MRAKTARGRKCSSQTIPTANRVSIVRALSARRAHARRNLVAVVAPQVLLGAAQDEPLERAVERAHRRLRRLRSEQRLDLEAVAAPPRQPPRVAQQNRGSGLLR